MVRCHEILNSLILFYSEHNRFKKRSTKARFWKVTVKTNPSKIVIKRFHISIQQWENTLKSQQRYYMHKSEFQMVKKDKNPTSIAFAIMRFMVAIKSYFRNISLVARYNRKVSAVSSFFFSFIKTTGTLLFYWSNLTRSRVL